MFSIDYKKLIIEERKAILNKEKIQNMPDQHLQTDIKSSQTTNENECHYHRICYNYNNVNLNCYKVGLIDNMYYIPDFISLDTETQLIDQINAMGLSENPWVHLRTRKLQCIGSFPELTNHIPIWLNEIINDIVNFGIFDQVFRPNNILINQYNPMDGVLHHTDGPIYEDRVAIISLGSDCLMSFRKNLKSNEIGIEYSGDIFSVVLRRNSLFIFEKDSYTNYMHGISLNHAFNIIDKSINCINIDLAEVKDNEKVSEYTTIILISVLSIIPTNINKCFIYEF